MKNQIKYIIIAFLCAVSGTVWAEGAKPSADSVKVKNYVIGRVTDAVSGEPLMGVTVTSAPGVSTLTDEDGPLPYPGGFVRLRTEILCSRFPYPFRFVARNSRDGFCDVYRCIQKRERR